MTSSTSFKVQNVLSLVSFFDDISLPNEPNRKEAAAAERYLDSTCASIDMLEFPPIFYPKSDEFFFKVIAEDLLLEEAHLHEINEVPASWKWTALQTLSQKLVTVYKKIHGNSTSRPLQNNKSLSQNSKQVLQNSPQPLQKTIATAKCNDSKVASNLQPLPKTSTLTPPLLERTKKAPVKPQTISSPTSFSKDSISFLPQASAQAPQPKVTVSQVQSPQAHVETRTPSPITDSESESMRVNPRVLKTLVPLITKSSQDVPSHVDQRHEILSEQASHTAHQVDQSTNTDSYPSQGTEQKEYIQPSEDLNRSDDEDCQDASVTPLPSPLGRESPALSTPPSSEDDPNPKIEAPHLVNIFDIEKENWQIFNRRNIRAKIRVFSKLTTKDSIYTTLAKEILFRRNELTQLEEDRLALVWAAKESLSSTSSAWKLSKTKEAKKVQVLKIQETLKPLEKYELLRRCVFFIQGAKGKITFDFFLKSFFDSSHELDEDNKKAITLCLQKDKATLSELKGKSKFIAAHEREIRNRLEQIREKMG